MFESQRLRFRPHRELDLEPFCAMQMDAEFRQYVGGKARSREGAERKFWSTYFPAPKDELALWATEWKANGEYIGYCGIYPHFGEDGIIEGEGMLAFYLARRYWGRGLATEAGAFFLTWAFETKGLSRVVASLEEGNMASRRVLEKLNVRYVNREAGRRVFLNYEILPDEWNMRPASG
ncbi:MAG: GNAT family N-acetyltransferase [Bacteroidota bacterium]